MVEPSSQAQITFRRDLESRLCWKSCRGKGSLLHTVASKPSGPAFQIKPIRIALWDRYGGSMPSGWTRWIFEQFDFPFTVVYAPTLDAGDLASKFDVIVFVSGAIPAARGAGAAGVAVVAARASA
jgi:hypothetical protein